MRGGACIFDDALVEFGVAGFRFFDHQSVHLALNNRLESAKGPKPPPSQATRRIAFVPVGYGGNGERVFWSGTAYGSHQNGMNIGQEDNTRETLVSFDIQHNACSTVGNLI